MANLIPEPQRINNNDKGWIVRTILNGLHSIFGDAINKLEKDKLNRNEIANLSVGIKDYKDDVTNIADLPKTGNAQGDARVVINDKDPNGRSYIWLWSGTAWSRTAFTSFPGDILTLSDVTQQVTEDSKTAPANKAVAEALRFKSSINRFFGRPAIDFLKKEIKFEQGYFSYARKAYKITEQILTYTEVNSMHICLDIKNWKWELIPITDNTDYLNLVYVGFIDIGNSNVIGNFREADLGNRLPIGNQGFVLGSYFSFKINFNTSEGWEITTTTGYLTTENGNNIITLNAQNLKFESKSIHYVYVDTTTKSFVVYPYNLKPTRSFLNLYYLGVINPSDKSVFLNVSKLIIDGEEKTLNNAYQRIRVLEDRYMPTSDDINKLLAKNDTVILQPRNYLITTPINLTSGKTLLGNFGKTNLILTNENKKLMNAVGAEGIKLSDFGVKGTHSNYVVSPNGIDNGANIIANDDEALELKYMGDEIGMYFESCEHVILDNLRISNFTGSGIRINRVGRDYTKGMHVSKIFIDNCYNGVFTEKEHEFSSYSDFTIASCQIGLSVDSGNLIYNAGTITKCRVGAMYTGGYNHAHGVMSAMEIKHNQIAGLLCRDIIHGQSFQGMNISSCDVIIRDSKGIYFDTLNMLRGKVICTNEKGVIGKNAIGMMVRGSSDANVINGGNLKVINTINMFE